MYYIILSPYTRAKPSKQKVDEVQVLSCLEKINLLAPHKVHIQSQSHVKAGQDWIPYIDLTEDLVYDCNKHGFVIEHDTIQVVSGALSAQSCTEGP